MDYLLRHEHRAIAIGGGPRPGGLRGRRVRDVGGRVGAGIVAIDPIDAITVLLRENGGRTVVGNVAMLRGPRRAGVVCEVAEGPAGGKNDILSALRFPEARGVGVARSLRILELHLGRYSRVGHERVRDSLPVGWRAVVGWRRW